VRFTAHPSAAESIPRKMGFFGRFAALIPNVATQG